jgi:hypothetical protein
LEKAVLMIVGRCPPKLRYQIFKSTSAVADGSNALVTVPGTDTLELNQQVKEFTIHGGLRGRPSLRVFVKAIAAIKLIRIALLAAFGAVGFSCTHELLEEEKSPCFRARAGSLITASRLESEACKLFG